MKKIILFLALALLLIQPKAQGTHPNFCGCHDIANPPVINKYGDNYINEAVVNKEIAKAISSIKPVIVTKVVHDTSRIVVNKTVTRRIHDTIQIPLIVEKVVYVDSSSLQAPIKPVFTSIDMQTKLLRVKDKEVPYVEKIYYDKSNNPILVVKLDPITLEPILD